MAQEVSHAELVPPHVGTFLGQHTSAELREWLTALDYQIAQLTHALAVFTPAWSKADPTSFAAWLADWNALLSRYTAARRLAQNVLAGTGGIVAMTAEGSWQAVERALTQIAGKRTAGDYQDLYARFVPPVDMSQTPQPSAPDADLIVFQKSDALLAGLKKAAPVVGLGLGAIALIAGAVYLAPFVLPLLVRKTPKRSSAT
jgi:hypothetical protein